MPELTTAVPILALIAVIAFLVGSIPFGIVVARTLGLGDLRKIGSGNIGATNVLRTGSKLGALATLILDAGKGGFAVLIARALFAEDAAQVAGACAFIGHIFPVWLRFRGGKGVATYLGTLLGLSFTAGALACLTWLVFALLFRMSSLAALAAAALMPLWLIGIGTPEILLLSLVLGALIWMRHAGNIRRILAGTESKISFKRS